ncbi:serine/threonine protein kinase [Arthrobacter sp. MN05-02]|nr:serine/threonine protein kinase [Arthrobacter sp. MN05-02]
MEKQALAGRYDLGERVGTGGMAEVFAARDTRLERDVAVKLFRPGTADGLERGSAEARMLAGLDHPGLVRVLDMDNGDDAGDSAYLVMELVKGPDLGVLLRTSGSMGREQVRLMALDLARTLHYIHGRGIVHRDIKPSNILTRPADPQSGLFRYLLTDFGIARFFDGGRMTATGQVIGSAAYFSPEQARGDAVGQPSDVYSLGLVMIEALTGERAFPGTGIESALARLSRSPSIPHGAGPALSALLVSMTLDDPADRTDAAGVVRALTVMGPQRPAEEPATRARPVDDPPTAAMPLPAAVGPDTGPAVPSPGTVTEGTARIPQAVTATRAVLRPAGPTAEPARAVAATAPTSPAATGEPSADRRAHGVPDPAGTDPMSPSGGAGGGTPSSGQRPAGRRRRVLPWLFAVLLVVLVAAGIWAFMTLSGGTPPPGVEPLPAVSGEPGERLQELYESVQR